MKKEIKCLRLTLQGLSFPVESLLTDLASIWILEKNKQNETNLRQMSDAGIVTEIDPNWVRIDNRQKLAEKRAREENEKKLQEIKREKKARVDRKYNEFQNIKRKRKSGKNILMVKVSNQALQKDSGTRNSAG